MAGNILGRSAWSGFRAIKMARRIRRLRAAVQEAKQVAELRRVEAVSKLAESGKAVQAVEAVEAESLKAAEKLREAKQTMEAARADFVHADQVLMSAESGTINHTSIERAREMLESARIAREQASEALKIAEFESGAAIERVRTTKLAADEARAAAVHADGLSLLADQRVGDAEKALAQARSGSAGAAMVVTAPGTSEASDRPVVVEAQSLSATDVAWEVAGFVPIPGFAEAENFLMENVVAPAAISVMDHVVDPGITGMNKYVVKPLAPYAEAVLSIVPGGEGVVQAVVAAKAEQAKGSLNRVSANADDEAINRGLREKNMDAVWAAAGKKTNQTQETQNFTPMDNFTPDTADVSQETCQSVDSGVAAPASPKISP
ncbi:MAG: hypothetical protein R3F23_05355 [Verrucomicrobiia bacterium]